MVIFGDFLEVFRFVEDTDEDPPFPDLLLPKTTLLLCLFLFLCENPCSQEKTLRVQVSNNHILTQNQYYNYYYPKPKYLIIGYMDPVGKG